MNSTILLLISVALPAQAQLTAKLEVDTKASEPRVYYDAPVRVILRNESNQVIRIWDPETKPGQSQISLEFVDAKTGKSSLAKWVEITDDEYWKAVGRRGKPRPETIAIKPRGEVFFDIVLNEIAWGQASWSGMPSPNVAEPYHVAARFANADGAAAGVWQGAIKSPPVLARFVAPRLATPQDYLRDGFAEKAIAVMTANKKLIEIRDGDGCLPLHQAARYGPPSAVAWLLANGANVNAVAYNKFTALHLADDPDIVRLILQKKPDLTRVDVSAATALQHAADEFVNPRRTAADRQRWGEIVKLLTEALGGTDLFTAITLGDLTRVKAILTKSPKLADDFQGGSPLRAAAHRGQLEICRYLLDNHRVDVDDWERGVGYPIIKSALPHHQIVKLLIDKGADLKRPVHWQGGRSGRWLINDPATLLHYAADDGTPETIKLLIDHGVDIEALDQPLFQGESKQSALEIAALQSRAANARAIVGHPKFDQIEPTKKQAMLDKCLRRGSLGSRLSAELLEVLLQKGANPRTASDSGITPMQTAARAIHPHGEEKNEANKRVVALLVKHGAKLDLFSAVAIGDAAAVKKLLAAEPKTIDARGPDGYPALSFAVGMDYRSIVEILLQAGADVNIRNESPHTGNRGETPLDCADFWEREELVKMLEAAGGKRQP